MLMIYITRRTALVQRSKLMSVALTLSALFGCAAPDTNVNQPANEEKQIVTGSNIPRKDRTLIGTKTVDKGELERVANNPTAGGASPSAK